ncbi:MAG: hypothetical protein PHU43_07325 [Candidatus Bipolaricaulis sp.]|nr:hypothetical protein [Candidatus Bipolaricaulis sp.]
MMTSPSDRFSLLRSIGLSVGATFFAYPLSQTLHEFGHYLAGIFLGVPGKGIVLHPLGANYNIRLGDLTTAFGSPERRIVSGMAGAIFDLLVSVTIGLVLWRKRSPGLLPFLAMEALLWSMRAST